MIVSAIEIKLIYFILVTEPPGCDGTPVIHGKAWFLYACKWKILLLDL